jgi:hypothetical protein
MGIIETSLQVKYNSPSPDDRALLILRRTLRIVNEILKEISSIKMPSGIRAMGQVQFVFFKATARLIQS